MDYEHDVPEGVILKFEYVCCIYFRQEGDGTVRITTGFTVTISKIC